MVQVLYQFYNHATPIPAFNRPHQTGVSLIGLLVACLVIAVLSGLAILVIKRFQSDRNGMQQRNCLLQILIGPGPKHSQSVPDYTCVRAKTQIVAGRVPTGVKDGRSLLIKTETGTWNPTSYCYYVPRP